MSREGSRDEPSQEMVMLCKLIAESQGQMLQKLAESQGDMLQKLTESQGDMLQKLTESQERSQQKLLETVTTNFNKGLEKVLSRRTGDEEESEDESVVEEKQKNDADKNNDNIVDEYEELYNAAYEGDWRKAREFLKRFPEAVEKTITFDDETALHIAINNERWSFAQELVKLMTPEALEIKDSDNSTALHGAALYGNIKTAEAIVRKNPKLTQMRDDDDLIPLQTAIIYISTGQKETVKYLYSVTKHEHPSPFSDTNGAELLCSAIEYGFYDLALSLVKRFPKLVTKKTEGDRGICGLQKLMDRPFAFKSGANFPWWEGFIYSLIHVDMSSPYDKDTEEVDDNSLKNAEGTNETPLESIHGQEGDLENPSGITKVTTADESEAPKKVSDAPSIKENVVMRAVKNFISDNIIPYYARAPLIRRLYSQKLMHKRAFILVNYMVSQLKKEKSTNQQEVIDFLNDTAIVNTAIEYGITEFVAECLEKFRFVIWNKFDGETMIQIAIKQRDEKILNLILETSGNDRDDLVSREDGNYNSILHYAANLAPSAKLNLVSGAALQMQREIQWFKGIENIVHPQYKYTRNGDKETAKFVFTEQHKQLVEKGEKWMKDTSGSCMVVATLIATVAFAAAFTVPGGNISDTQSPRNGVPIFLGRRTFALFAVADAVALFSSITSVLMFLAIMTSRYAEEDFYKSLPQKLIIGLATLFISMASILISFGAAFTIVLRHKYSWAPIPVASFGLVSVLLFAFLEFPLFLEMVYFTYSPRIFGNKNQNVVNKKKTTKAKEIEAKKEV
ncbi:hypothetical protein MKW98_012911 [Papaver atlanticum]|uniref:PGG domain-containing protein n=1 Tax=Papaver atlanticum TaxID=357466 RepID=A0AAD4SJU2_9MAGN|nr:hypothetical protein MKW98_012911 [Papaver atlanticum]